MLEGALRVNTDSDLSQYWGLIAILYDSFLDNRSLDGHSLLQKATKKRF